MTRWQSTLILGLFGGLLLLWGTLLGGCGNGGDGEDDWQHTTRPGVVPPRVFLAGDDDGFHVKGDTVMTWAFIDQCADGRGLKVRLHDVDNGLTWPRDPAQVFGLKALSTTHIRIECLAGATVCYGARQWPEVDLVWGVDLDGQRGCEACCAVCASGPEVVEVQC